MWDEKWSLYFKPFFLESFLSKPHTIIPESLKNLPKALPRAFLNVKPLSIFHVKYKQSI